MPHKSLELYGSLNTIQRRNIKEVLTLAKFRLLDVVLLVVGNDKSLYKHQ